MSTKLFLLTALIGIVHQSSSSDSGLFAADLFRQISEEKTSENVILSPISVQTALAMTYLGAEGETARELEEGLRLPSSNKEEVGEYFAEILKEKEGEAQLTIANRLFINSDYQLRSTFNDLAMKYFKSEAEAVNFSESSDAIKTINTWVEEKTNNKITNMLEDGSVDHRTIAIIVNAIYFKGKWQTPFSKDSTLKKPFWVTQKKSVNVDTMYTSNEFFFYAELSEFDATALEMPYLGSNISMVIILPKERDGLAALEEKLSSVAINQLSSMMTIECMNVSLPKFKIEFAAELTDVLKAMGIRSLFENSASLSGIFESGPSGQVSEVLHNAFIDVNEAGSEAAAATIIKAERSRNPPGDKFFEVDHPFVFAIKSPETVYFMGHIATL